MERKTRADLVRKLELINKCGFDFSIDWAYGQPSITNASGSRQISPRLPLGQLLMWMDGFYTSITERTNNSKAHEFNAARAGVDLIESVRQILGQSKV